MRPHHPTSLGLIVLSVILYSAPHCLARRGGVPMRTKAAPLTPRMTFQSLYAKADSALEGKDLDGGLAYHDTDFVEEEQNGDETDLGEVRYRISTWFDLAKAIHSSTSVVSANVQGV